MKIAIIGGGAAGLMAATALHEADADVEIFVIERNDGLGKKVIISGGGRCNVTTGLRDVRTVLTNYPRGGKFLSSGMHAFPPEAVYQWFESHGVPLKTDGDLRVFPQSNNGKDIVRVFEELFRAPQIHVMLKTQAVRVVKLEKGFEIVLKGQNAPLAVDALVLTTGGQAYRSTGSTGDGYAFATSLGHSITALAPSLNAFFTRETWPHDVSGLSFDRAKFTAKRTGNPSFIGPFLFTHKGVSGPAVFALSSKVAFETYDAAQPLEITIDLFPDRSVAELQHLVETAVAENPKRSVTNTLATLVPKSLALILCSQLVLSGDARSHDLTKKDRMRVASWLKGIPLSVVQRGGGDEFVTAGGVNLKEVNPATMESKLCPGLYFAGEILDVDGFTGGFNLQASWATGHLAGEKIAASRA